LIKPVSEVYGFMSRDMVCELTSAAMVRVEGIQPLCDSVGARDQLGGMSHMGWPGAGISSDNVTFFGSYSNSWQAETRADLLRHTLAESRCCRSTGISGNTRERWWHTCCSSGRFAGRFVGWAAYCTASPMNRGGHRNHAGAQKRWRRVEGRFPRWRGAFS